MFLTSTHYERPEIWIDNVSTNTHKPEALEDQTSDDEWLRLPFERSSQGETPLTNTHASATENVVKHAPESPAKHEEPILPNKDRFVRQETQSPDLDLTTNVDNHPTLNKSKPDDLQSAPVKSDLKALFQWRTAYLSCLFVIVLSGTYFYWRTTAYRIKPDDEVENTLLLAVEQKTNHLSIAN